jgi:diguanylate cyclase (GGDEF)-like protein
MLSVPTLWTVFIVNFLTLGSIWAYVAHSYPRLAAARFWTASAFSAVAGGMIAMLRQEVDSLLPLLAGGTLTVFAACLASMGVSRFYGQAVSWHRAVLITGGTCAGLLFFIYGHDSLLMRMTLFSFGLSLPLGLVLKPLLARQEGRANPGARLAGVLALLITILCAARVVGILSGVNLSVGQPGPVAPFMVLGLMFLSMSMNFGFLLMAVDRLRNEVADLALIDDLTGVANRRHLMQRLGEECARSERNGTPFSLLVIDLDSFKTINDTRGHAAGDACLQHFTLMAQTRLKPGDMLARTGGDEFCIVLPSSTLREAAMIARRVLQVCREDAEACVGADIPISISIGVAQWTAEVGSFPDLLIAHADHALYAAKKDGKNRYAVYSSAPPVAPEVDEMTVQTPRNPGMSGRSSAGRRA